MFVGVDVCGVDVCGVDGCGFDGSMEPQLQVDKYRFKLIYALIYCIKRVTKNNTQYYVILEF